MNCRDVIDRLDELLDGAPEAELARRCRDHLAACPPCATYAESYAATVRIAALLREDGLDPAPEGWLAGLAAAARRAARGH